MRVIYTLILAIFFIVSCNNEDDIIGGGNSGSLSFSVDTLLFDTVFTTVGSATRYLKVYNNSNSDINLENVYLNGGETSPFRINVDGESGTVVNDILIRAKDSLYVFADVNINPNDGLNSYFIEQDKIIFDYDNTNQNVDLTAWGIDAYFYPGISDHQSEFQYVDSIDFDGDGIQDGDEPSGSTDANGNYAISSNRDISSFRVVIKGVENVKKIGVNSIQQMRKLIHLFV